MTATEEPRAANPRLRTVRIDVAGEARSYVSGDQRITSVPLSIRRKQNRKLLTPPTGEVSALGTGGLDVPMIKTLGKAFYWQSLLDEGRYSSSNALARAQQRHQDLGIAHFSPKDMPSCLAGLGAEPSSPSRPDRPAARPRSTIRAPAS